MPRYEIFYDDACPMCRFEILRLLRLDTENCFSAIDISNPHADLNGLDIGEMQQLLHIRRDDGQMLIGVDAIAALYQAIGHGWWTGPLLWKISRPAAARLYAWVARHRYRISALLGFAPRCTDGVCKL
ncbi:thiol-disulfide oxidoreductase DCC family protein [Chitinibacter sp. S2-10]|uniref:thiol-disulfide oxidoreductase DCC family protein n=1 Tax=Chitinibacter sp. S2-10 TaxID=3373597 RepID=UPI0039777B80